MSGICQHGPGKQNGEKAAHHNLEPEQNSGCCVLNQIDPADSEFRQKHRRFRWKDSVPSDCP